MDELELELVGLAGHLAAAHCRWLLLLAEFDTREGWAGPGLRTCAHWLSWRVGMSLRTGFEQVRVAHALKELSAIPNAFSAGRISYSKVRALTRIATPGNEQRLLELALAGTVTHVERVVRAARQDAADPSAAQARRYLEWDWQDDGTLRLRGRLAAEQGALLVAALDRLTDRPPLPQLPDRQHCSAERDETHAVLSSAEHDEEHALSSSAEHDGASAGLSSAEHDQPGRVEPLAVRRADALAALVSGERTAQAEIVLHIDADRASAAIEGGPSVPPATAERLACDARVRLLAKDRRGNPLYLGRTRRLVSKVMLAALGARDGHRCRFPGCGQTRHLHAHHIRSWLRGGRTDLDNTVLLCARHHQLVHDRGYRVLGRGVELRFHRPDGQPIAAAGPPTCGDLDTLLARYTDDTVTATSITPSWAGERLDVTSALLALLPQSREAVAA